MRRVIAPALLALFVFAGSSADAGFGLFGHHGGNGCDSGCAVEPVCGCEEVVEPCCDAAPSCRGGLLHKLFHHHNNNACDMGCGSIEPACGCEVAPADCGCAVVEPACGCEVAAPCCDAGHKRHGLLHKLFHHHRNADCGCAVEPACGCEVAPSCGCGF